MAGRLSRPRQLGRDLLVQVGVLRPEQIDPIETAKELGVEITYGDLKGATARIHRIGSKARIRVSDQIVTEGRRRMSITHELGHYVLGHTLPAEGDLTSWFHASCAHRDKRDERDADVLAVEHLTPEPMVRSFCEVTPVDLHAVRGIERTFVTSPVMAAMRFVELSREACAVVYSVAGRVAWMRPSRTFPGFISKGTALANGSIACEYFDRGAICAEPQRRYACSWLGSRPGQPIETEIVEHATLIPEPGWGGVLSLLWIPQWNRSEVMRSGTNSDQDMGNTTS